MLSNKIKIKGKVLVIDDDEDDHEILREVCASLDLGDPLVFFQDGIKFLEYLKTTHEQPFLVICDVNMPRINGLELRQIICDNETLKKQSIPFVFFSTTASKEQVIQAYDLTVQGFFVKGTSLEETKDRLRLLLHYWSECRHPNSL